MSKQLHETILFPDASFPYIMYTANSEKIIPEGRGFNDLHWHEELQITLVTQGRLVIQVNGVDHELLAGQAILINKGVLHVTTHLTHNGQYVSFNFPEKLLAFYADSAMEKNYVLPYTDSSLVSLVIKGDVEWQQIVLDMLWDMKKRFDMTKKWGWEYEVSIKTVQLWLILIHNITLSSEEAPKYVKLQQERLQLMLSFIHQQYSTNITLQEIADTAHLSISECTRSFKKTIHMTPYDYLIKYRIKKSMELLISTDYTVTEIAHRVGFNHVNNFIQSFKKHQNQTPKSFRNSSNEIKQQRKN
ncbi:MULTISPECIES: AraC family transcriptional regulator [Paenibacillus]|uniref:Helix-turn-helix domain-containing protein n=1 Tax=Paenibacillus taichungensis TaxID=484184 RepID=A0ABX2MRQ2_9BACL|nr:MULTISPECIES: helix-turn-helix domain-containing protein [Paenibacillus]MDR9745875.1 AraC family transcriptional regulator [Paenibacillus taichungensis]NUU56756.1 helix-turn-helix domain-containing protein [Paenibacillus taichungensis]PIH60443.1 AraC family transcriptional regulator [Paenibacillus sp. LK1]